MAFSPEMMLSPWPYSGYLQGARRVARGDNLGLDSGTLQRLEKQRRLRRSKAEKHVLGE